MRFIDGEVQAQSMQVQEISDWREGIEKKKTRKLCLL